MRFSDPLYLLRVSFWFARVADLSISFCRGALMSLRSLLPIIQVRVHLARPMRQLPGTPPHTILFENSRGIRFCIFFLSGLLRGSGRFFSLRDPAEFRSVLELWPLPHFFLILVFSGRTRDLTSLDALGCFSQVWMIGSLYFGLTGRTPGQVAVRDLPLLSFVWDFFPRVTTPIQALGNIEFRRTPMQIPSWEMRRALRYWSRCFKPEPPPN